MSKSHLSPAALPAPAAVAPDASLETLSPDFEIVEGPDMSGFTERVRAVQGTIATKRQQVHDFLVRRQVDIAYDLIEIGWIFLQGKAAIEHGQAGNSNALKNKSETVSDLFSGFGNWLSANFAEINERSARNYMNAARNMKLSATSTLEEVRALREMGALVDKRLKDLYLPPRGEDEDDGTDPEADAQQARVEAESKRLEESLFDLTQLGVEKRVFVAWPKPRLQLLKGQLHDLQKAVAEALKA